MVSDVHTAGVAAVELVKVHDAERVVALLADVAVLVLVAHGALAGAVLGLAVALPVGAMQDGVAAIAVAAAAARGVVGLAVPVMPSRFLKRSFFPVSIHATLN